MYSCYSWNPDVCFSFSVYMCVYACICTCLGIRIIICSASHLSLVLWTDKFPHQTVQKEFDWMLMTELTSAILLAKRKRLLWTIVASAAVCPHPQKWGHRHYNWLVMKLPIFSCFSTSATQKVTRDLRIYSLSSSSKTSQDQRGWGHLLSMLVSGVIETLLCHHSVPHSVSL